MSSYGLQHDDDEPAVTTTVGRSFDHAYPAPALYTLIESARRHGHEPYAYFSDVLERLPAMKQSEIGLLLTRIWKLAEEPGLLDRIA